MVLYETSDRGGSCMWWAMHVVGHAFGFDAGMMQKWVFGPFEGHGCIIFAPNPHSWPTTVACFVHHHPVSAHGEYGGGGAVSVGTTQP